MADFLDEKRKEIQARLKELKPMVEEYTRLEAAERALSGVESNGTSGAAASTAAPARRRRSGGSGTGRRGRPRGSGTRAVQAFDLVKARPGIVTKSGRGWHARGE
jgi:hypothetical protein